MDEEDQLKNLRQMLRDCNGDTAALAARLRAESEAPLPSRVSKAPPATAGRPSLYRYIVAIKHKADAHWPAARATDIKRAQRLYDAGTHEVFQAHDDPWRILYCKARVRPVPVRNYFRTMVAFHDFDAA